MDLSIYKVDLDTDQPNGGKGESPRSAFTKYNNSLDTINGELTTLGDRAAQKSANLSDLTDAATARNNLGLGSASTRNVGTDAGNVMEVGAFGLGSNPTLNDNTVATRFSYYGPNNKPTGYLSDWYEYGVLGSIRHEFSGDVAEFIVTHIGNTLAFRGSRVRDWRTVYHSGNTTVDGSGFIKQASPIINLYRDKIEQPIDGYLELEDVSFERLGVGHYVLQNAPLLSRDGWYIETPKDRNNNIYFYLDYEENETDKTLTIKTYEPDYSSGRAEAGEPVDILEGRFVSLRFEEDASLYVEQEIGND